jgi:predicted branched-subunit amino acid permease
MNENDLSRSQSFLSGARDGIPIALGYFAVSFTFGMMSVKDGLGIFQAVLISLTNVTSAGQFAALDIIVSGGTFVEMALTQLVINMRYSLMSFSLSQKLDRRESWGWRYLVAFGVTDEIFGISVSRPGKVSAFYNIGAMAVAIPGWVLGTTAGAISGKILPAFLISSLSVAIYGMFMALIIPPSKKDRTVAAVVVCSMAMSCAFAYLPLLRKISSGFVIIIVTVVAAGIAAWLKSVDDDEEKEKETGNAGK